MPTFSAPTLPDEVPVDPRDLKQAQKGDPDAFTRVIEGLIDRLDGFTRYMCTNREDAEDTLQETLLTAFRKLPEYRGEGPLRSWLFRIISTHCQKKRRRRVGEPERHVSLDELTPEALRPVREGASLATIATLPLDEVVQGELLGRIETAIASLPEEYRLVLALRDVEGFSTAETAAMTGLSEAAVKSRLHRARIEVRLQLQTYLEEAAGE